MHNLSMTQALNIWGELLDALRECNGFGGNEAEIYVYRLQSRCPMSELGSGEMWAKAKLEQAVTANRSLHALIEHFISVYEATVTIEGEPFGDWLKESEYDYRWHIKVNPK